MKKVITVSFKEELVESGNDFYIRLTPRIRREHFTKLSASEVKKITNEIKEEFRKRKGIK